MGPKKVEFVSPDIQHSADNLSSESPSPDHVLDQVFVEPRRKTKINKAFKTLNKRVSSIGATISRTTGIVDGDTSDSDSINDQVPALSEYSYGKDGNLKEDSEFKIIHDSLVPEQHDDGYYDDYSDDDNISNLPDNTPDIKNTALPDRRTQWMNQQSQHPSRRPTDSRPTDPRPQVFLPKSLHPPGYPHQPQTQIQPPQSYFSSQHYNPPISQRNDDYYRQYSQYQQQLQQQQLQQQLKLQQQQEYHQRIQLQQQQLQRQYQNYPQPQMHPQAAEFMNKTVSAQQVSRSRRNRQTSDPTISTYPSSSQPKPSRRKSSIPKTSYDDDYINPPSKTHYTFGDDEQRARRRSKIAEKQNAIKNQFWNQYIDLKDDQANDYPSPNMNDEEEHDRPGTAMSTNSFLSVASTPSVHSSVSQRPAVKEPRESPKKVSSSEESEKLSKFSAKGLFNMMKKSPKKDKPLSLHEQIMSSPSPASSSAPHRSVPSSPASHRSVVPSSPAVSHRSLVPSVPPSPAISHHTTRSGSVISSVHLPEPPNKFEQVEMPSDKIQSASTQNTALGEIYNTFTNAGGYVYNLAANSGYKLPAAGLLGSLLTKGETKAAADVSNPKEPSGNLIRPVPRSIAPSVISSASKNIAVPPAGTTLDSADSDGSDVDDEYDAKSIIGDNSPPGSPVVFPEDPIPRQSSPLELTKSQKRFQKTMKFLFQKNSVPPAGTLLSDTPDDTPESSVIEERGISDRMSKRKSYESLKSKKSVHGQPVDGSSQEEQFSLEPLISTFVELFRNCARISFVLRPVDAVADAFPSLQNAVVVIELILLMWLLYQLSIIVETIATAVKTFCMPVIIICRLLGITY